MRLQALRGLRLPVFTLLLATIPFSAAVRALSSAHVLVAEAAAADVDEIGRTIGTCFSSVSLLSPGMLASSALQCCRS